MLPLPLTAAEFAGRYFGSDNAPAVLEVTARRPPTFSFLWRSELGKRTRGLGLSDGEEFLAASVNTGGAAYGLAVFTRSAGAWRGRWITSIDGGSAVGEMTLDGEARPGRRRFSGRGRAGAFEGSVNITARGGALQLNFISASGTPLYRGIGAVSGNRLAVAWSFGGSPVLAAYTANPRGLAGQRFSFARGQNDAAAAPERFTREGMEDTIFPPMLPSPEPRHE